MMFLMYLSLLMALLADASCNALVAKQETTAEIMARPAVVPVPPREANPVRRTGPALRAPAVVKPALAKKIEITPEAEQLLRDYESAREVGDAKRMKEIREKLEKMEIEIPE